ESTYSSCWRCAGKPQHPPSYDSILRILEDAHLHTIDDVAQLQPSFTFQWGMPPRKRPGRPQLRPAEYLSHKQFPWVKDIFDEVQELYPAILVTHEFSGEARLSVGKPYAVGNWHTWTPDNEIFHLRAKASCLFPRRVLHLSHQFVYWIADDEIAVPSDFVSSAIALRPALRSGLAYLLPSRIVHKLPLLSLSDHIIGTYDHIDMHPRAVTWDTSGYGITELARVNKSDPELAGGLLAVWPWTVGARLDDYVDLAERHADELELHSQVVGRLLSTAHTSESLLKAAIGEATEACARLDVLLSKQRRRLRARGRGVAAGALLAAGT